MTKVFLSYKLLNRSLFQGLIIFTLFLTWGFSHSIYAQVPNTENTPLLSEISLFGEQITSGVATAKDLRALISKVNEDEKLYYESRSKVETLLLRAYKNSKNKDLVNTSIAEAVSEARTAYIHTTPSLINASLDIPLYLEPELPISSQAAPITPYPTNLGFNYKDPLEFCDITSLSDQVLNTNYKDLNLQLRQRFKGKTLDEIADLIIHQRAIDMASYATMTSAAAYATSLAAYKLPATLGGSGKTSQLIGGKITVVTGAALVSTTLLYLDICSYAQQNARMIFQLADLYDTGTFYTIDEKQKFASQVLLYSMAGKTAGKFALESHTTRTIGALAKDVSATVLTQGGNFIRGLFEQVSSGIKSGVLKADAIHLSQTANPLASPTAPITRPVTPTVPGQPVLPVPTPPRDVPLEVSMVSPWALLALPANGLLTYYSMQAVGKGAQNYIKSERNKVYTLPMTHDYVQEAVFKVLIFAAIATETARENSLNPATTISPPLVSQPPRFPNPVTQPTIEPPKEDQPSPVAPPVLARSVQSPQMRAFINMVYSKYNPDKSPNTRLYQRIQDEMNAYDSTIPKDIANVFNDELNSVPVKRALIRLIVEMLYMDHQFDIIDRNVLKTIQTNVLGLQDPNFADLIYRDVTEEATRHQLN